MIAQDVAEGVVEDVRRSVVVPERPAPELVVCRDDLTPNGQLAVLQNTRM